MQREAALLLQGNMPIHTAPVAADEAVNSGFELLPHPPYSPALAPSDLFLFPKHKSYLRGGYFGNNDQIISAVQEFFEDFLLGWNCNA